MECVSESAELCRCLQMSASASFCAGLPSSRMCCRSLVQCQFGRCVSAPHSGLRTEPPCPYPSLRGWYRTLCSRGIGEISVRPCVCCSIASVSVQSSCCCSVLCSNPEAELACTCPSPEGWCRVGCSVGMDLWGRIVVVCGCCSFASAS